MRKFVLSASLAFAAVLMPATAMAGDGCYICASGSTNGCQQCRYGSSDTQSARKDCEKKGCKIGGTTSCSSAANVKVCVMPTATQKPVETASIEKLECAPN
jgi:hypothetical protein